MTSGAIGTTTYVCHGVALAFGHPFDFTGPSALGANGASAVAIVDDSVRGSYKLANIGAPFGKVDQDRMAGIRATLGSVPSQIPVTSTVTNGDNGVGRAGETAVTTSDWIPEHHGKPHLRKPAGRLRCRGCRRVADVHVGHGKACERGSMDVRVHRPVCLGGNIPYASVDEFYGQLYSIFNNPYEAITFDSVTVKGTIDSTVDRYAVGTVLVSKNGGPFKERSNLTVKPGDTLRFRITVTNLAGVSTQKWLSLVVPNTPTDSGALYLGSVTGSNPYSGTMASRSTGLAADAATTVSTFLTYLAAMQAVPRYDALLAYVLVPSDSSYSGTIAAQASKILDKVVTGGTYIPLVIQ